MPAYKALGRAVETAGATDITQVDESERALAFAAAHHVADSARHHFVTADVFAWLPALAADELYDLIIVDPPAMTSRAAQVPSVLAAYRKLYGAAARHVRPGGMLVAACCTSASSAVHTPCAVRSAIGSRSSLRSRQPISAGFARADYPKIECWRRGEAHSDVFESQRACDTQVECHAWLATFWALAKGYTARHLRVSRACRSQSHRP